MQQQQKESKESMEGLQKRLEDKFTLSTVEDFKAIVSQVENDEGYQKPLMFGFHRNHLSGDGENRVISIDFITFNFQSNFGTYAMVKHAIKELDIKPSKSDEGSVTYTFTPELLMALLGLFNPYIEGDLSEHKNILALTHIAGYLNVAEQDPNSGTTINNYGVTIVYDDLEVGTLECAYSKLHAMSVKAVKPRELNLDGIFGSLETIAWLSNGVCIDLETLRREEMQLRVTGTYPHIVAIDKFPLLLNKIVPDDSIRILDSVKVRYGAHVAEGTTVMPGASYINFNAGTLGASIVEGRISSNVIIGKNVDIGGGASILGTLSGGNNEPISIGDECLLGANSVTGMSIGKGCIIDAGTTVLPGRYITISLENAIEIQKANPDINIVEDNTMFGKYELNEEFNEFVIKTKDLKGLNKVHYRFDTEENVLVAKISDKQIELNEDLH